MTAWFRRWRRVDRLEAELAEARQALAEASARIADLAAWRSAATDEQREAGDRLRQEIASRVSDAEERGRRELAEQTSSLEDALGRRIDDADRAESRRVDEAERRSEEQVGDLRGAVAGVEDRVRDVRTEVRRLKIRLGRHVEETDRLGAALLDRAGAIRIGDVEA